MHIGFNISSIAHDEFHDSNSTTENKFTKKSVLFGNFQRSDR